MATVLWHSRLTAHAEQDFLEIIRWTQEKFGPSQAEAYRETILTAIQELQEGPDLLGVKRRDEIMSGLMTLHVARHGRRGRHFVMFRVDPANGNTIEILRLLHDSMDFARHLPDPETSE